MPSKKRTSYHCSCYMELFPGPLLCHEDAGPEPDGAGGDRHDQRDHQERLHLLPSVMWDRHQAAEGGGRGGLQAKHVQGQTK